jgi:NAD(P)H-hydrate epimerase
MVVGFGFSGQVRSPFDDVLNSMKHSDIPIISIDVPSGWDVDNVDNQGMEPEMLVSLTAPKLCAKTFRGKYHFLGGRFIPESVKYIFRIHLSYRKMAANWELNLPAYPDSRQIVQL